ncbi:Response regulator containing a CheY-like receiver domain and an HTH DNA-binding domain [Rubrobacter radiotolerans]|uniref:Response regulator containing a CheY-like receiver domain and an HTH DNA-binding domain n=1 Tax=Rubrobacter radiotolerans TaxID=42256 RepID=A0A023X333_RUBRA|nr:response regulator transcription factor [Rubrobacter radiotolerans]AHY46479.1 Response regulator containing a CheY-like receiver domain and an HTH DNA-binding domain [Rubrobacter radiotolerans]MDX5893886.1 response regulator transcription factor [Rubrobacter radiotolerans]SMC04696.1 two component transcriptional regulator, LuxR family [Rubrobacter radiotolerans DSM 5868]
MESDVEQNSVERSEREAALQDSSASEEERSDRTIRVVIADDHRLFTVGLARILALQPDMEIAAEVHDGRAAVEASLKTRPDVVLMDISMPLMSGVEATRRIGEELPGTAVLILTMYEDDDHVFRAVRAGARGYVMKDSTPESLTRAIRAVHAGETIMSPRIAQRLLDSEPERKPRVPCTQRELEVLRALSRGLSNKEVARELGISEKTVRNHASSIYRKLHIFDRTQAVLYAIREGLVDLDDLRGPDDPRRRAGRRTRPASPPPARS